MAVNRSPYDVLALSADATLKQIKAAHRKLVKKYHPDNGTEPDAGAFREVQEAYEVLSDDKRRAHFDKTGETEDRDVAAGLELNAMIMASLVDQMIVDNKPEQDLSLKVKRSLNDHISQCRAAVDQTNKLIMRARNLQGRFKFKGTGPDLLDNSFRIKIDGLTRQLAAQQSNLRVALKARELMEDYEFKVDPALTQGPNIRARSTTQGLTPMSSEQVEDIWARSGCGY
jgi:curved DNA-binding protein CbpA